MIIYAENLSQRFRYAVQCVFEDYCGEIELTNDLSYFQHFPGPYKVNYSNQKFSEADIFNITPAGVLEGQDYQRLKVTYGVLDDLPVLYPNQGDSGFDPLSAIFFALTRYEEYWRFEGDELGRYLPEYSIFSQMNVLHRPIADEWRIKLQSQLEKKFPGIPFEKRKSQFISTIDVDSAYAYLHKGAYRTFGAIVQDLFRFRIKNLSQRISIILKGENDPYDTYDYILEQHTKYNCKSIFFFLLADFGDYDKGLPHRSKGLQNLIRRIQKKSEIGIHPGVASHKRYNTILREKSRLETISAKSTKHSRQHYLLLRFRTTYRLLKATGIEHDYSLSYAHTAGFRAGTSRPFYWFDLKKNQATNLLIHPFPAMDTTLKKYMALSPESAMIELDNLVERIRHVGGDFISLWHNETLTDIGEWKGWREVFEHCLKLGKSLES